MSELENRLRAYIEAFGWKLEEDEYLTARDLLIEAADALAASDQFLVGASDATVADWTKMGAALNDLEGGRHADSMRIAELERDAQTNAAYECMLHDDNARLHSELNALRCKLTEAQRDAELWKVKALAVPAQEPKA